MYVDLYVNGEYELPDGAGDTSQSVISITANNGERLAFQNKIWIKHYQSFSTKDISTVSIVGPVKDKDVYLEFAKPVTGRATTDTFKTIINRAVGRKLT